MTNDLQSKIESILACPHCHGELIIQEKNMQCRDCGQNYRKTNGKYYFRDVKSFDKTDSLDRLKEIFKRFDKFYQLLILVVAPTMKMINLKKKYCSTNADNVILEIGSGNSNLDDTWIKIDYFDYPNVHIVCDSAQLPIKNNAVDIHYNVSVLEHVANPEKVVSEIHRTLKKGGRIISSVPFLSPYHASPHDYHRFTSTGTLHLFYQFRKIELGARSGPFSALLWIFQETIASLLSFGSRPLRNFILICLYLLLFPLKVLDMIFLVYPFHAIEGIASNFYFIGEKE